MSKRVLITGAAGGIGEASCRYFEERGYTVICHARREDQARKLAGNHARVPVFGDLTKPDEVGALSDQVKKAGALDMLVHNAGILSTSKQKGPSGIGIQAEVNVLAPLRLTEALVDHMKETSEKPVAVVVSSSAANFPRNSNYDKMVEPNGSSLFDHYALSKSAANALVLAMAKRWPELRFYSTEPGFVKTKMTAGNSSMPLPMRWLANIIGAKPENAAHRCFDFILDENPPSGSVVQAGKIVDSSKKKWALGNSREGLDLLLAKGGLAV